jgi:hypothetical protein
MTHTLSDSISAQTLLFFHPTSPFASTTVLLHSLPPASPHVAAAATAASHRTAVYSTWG